MSLAVHSLQVWICRLLPLGLSITYSLTAYAEEDLWLDSFASAPAVNIAHIAQNIRDTSASVSRITHEDIKRWNFRDWYDVLRTIPGMTVVKKSPPFSSVDYGSNGTRIGSGLEILVNGVRQTIPAQSSAFVELLPPLETIDTIEVVRGSNAAADGGSVSFKGTLHITTRDPKFQDNSVISAQASTREAYRLLAWHHGNIADHHVSMAIQYQQDEGFDQRKKIDSSDPQPILKDIDDDLHISQLHIFHSYEADSNTVLRSDFQLLDSKLYIPGTTLSKDRIPGSSPVDTRHYALSAAAEHWLADSQRVHLQVSHQDWRWEQNAELCGPTALLSPATQNFIQAYPHYLPNLVMLDIGGIPPSPELSALFSAFLSDPGSICTFRPQSYDLARTSLQTQYLMQWQKVHWITGVDFASTSVDGKLFRKRHRYDNTQLFTHLQWQIHRHLTANIGARFEDFYDEQGFSWRAGLNIHLTPEQTLRLVGSYSEKIPDIADIDNDFKQLYVISEHEAYGSTGHQLFDGSLLGTNTESQVIRSIEAGYFWQYQYRNQLDIRLFYDQMRNISSYDINLIFVPPAEDINKSGIELQFQGELALFHYNLALYFHHSTSDAEAEDYDKYGISLTGDYPLTHSLSLIGNLYYVRTSLTQMRKKISDPVEIYSLALKYRFNQAFSMDLTARYDTSYYLAQMYLPELNKATYDDSSSLIYAIEYTF